MRNLSNGLALDEEHECKLAKYCLDYASVCIFRANQEGRIVYANRYACDALGYSLSELLHLSVFDIAPFAKPEIGAAMWQKLCEEKSITAESRHIRKDGSSFPIEITVTLLKIDGQLFSMTITKDISERKQLDDSLRLFQFIFDQAPLGIFFYKRWGGDRLCQRTCQPLSRIYKRGN